MLLNNPARPEQRQADPAALFHQVRVHPFEETPCAPCVYLDGGRGQLIASIKAGVGRRGELVVVLGDPGSGKTSILLALAAALSTTNGAGLLCPQGVYPCRPETSFNDIMASCRRSAAFRRVSGFLPASETIAPVDGDDSVLSTYLLLDDVDHLEPAVLGYLVRLHQILEAGGAPLTMVMAAAKVPRSRLGLGGQTAPLASHRVMTLAPLGRDDVGRFIRHRLAAAGHVGSNPFSADACERIAELTGGCLAALTRLCGRTLDMALREHAAPILPPLVDEAAATLDSLHESQRGIVPVRQELRQRETKQPFAAAPAILGPPVAMETATADGDDDEARASGRAFVVSVPLAPAEDTFVADQRRSTRALWIALTATTVALLVATTVAIRIIQIEPRPERAATVVEEGAGAEARAVQRPASVGGDGAGEWAERPADTAVPEPVSQPERAGEPAPEAAPAPLMAPSHLGTSAAPAPDGHGYQDLPVAPSAASAVAPAPPAVGAAAPTSVQDLLQRGDQHLARRDFASAQPFYRLAAELGSGQAAMKLAMTMDPVLLRERDPRVKRARPDEALSWYDRAAALGEQKAAAHSARLQDWLRTQTSDTPDDR